MKTGIGWTELTKYSRPNFIDEEGCVYMVRCPKCEKENYVMAVMYGQCCWCAFDLNQPNSEREPKHRNAK